MRVKTQYKFFTWIVLIAIGSMPLDSLARSTITVQRSYDPSEIEVTTTTEDDGNNYSKIKWNDLYSNAKPGSPELPVDYVRFIVPMYSNNFSVTVTPDGSNADIPIEGRIYPAQTPRTTSDDSPPVFLAPSSDDYVPELNRIRAEVVGDGFIDGCNHIVTVAIYPFNYNDDALELTSDYGMTIELSYDERDASDLTSTPIVPPHRSKYLNLEETVVNPDNLAEFSTTDINLDAIDYYYIITPRNLADACEDLAIWKRQKGYNVVVKVVEDIFETPEYRVDVTTEIKDEAASLREYLKDEFEAHGAFFCLLVGDYRTSMPIRKSTCTCSWHVKKSTNPNSEYYVPTDMYFSDLSKKIDLVKGTGELIYSYPHDYMSTYYNPDIFIGRLCCNSSKDIKNYIRKLLIYESNPGYGDNDYLLNSFVFEQNPEIGTHTEVVVDALKGIYNVKFMNNSDNYHIIGADVIGNVNKSGFSSFHGHGDPYTIQCYRNYSMDYINYISPLDIYDGTYNGSSEFTVQNSNGLDNLTNYNNPSIAYSISCITTPFDALDYENGVKFDSGIYFGNAFTTYGNFGGVAYLGNTRFGWSISSPMLETKWVKMLNTYSKIGISEAYSKADFYNLHLQTTHSLIGEPEFEMWIDKPKIQNVEFNTNNSGITINGNDLINSKIYISNGEQYNLNYQISGNQLIYPNNGSNLISIWKTGYLPIINFYGYNSTVENCNKSFIAREARLGIGSNDKYSIGNNGFLRIHAIDSIITDKDFTVENNGVVELQCDRTIELKGSKIANGGKLSITAEEVTLSNGFQTDLGGELEILTNK